MTARTYTAHYFEPDGSWADASDDFATTKGAVKEAHAYLSKNATHSAVIRVSYAILDVKLVLKMEKAQ